jgi:hypothetical protein
MEPEPSSPHSQESTTSPYPELDWSSPCSRHTTSRRPILILSSHLCIDLSNHQHADSITGVGLINCNNTAASHVWVENGPSTAVRILNLGARCMTVISFQPLVLRPWGKNCRYPGKCKLSPRAPKNRSWRRRREKSVVLTADRTQIPC